MGGASLAAFSFGLARLSRDVIRVFHQRCFWGRAIRTLRRPVARDENGPTLLQLRVHARQPLGACKSGKIPLALLHPGAEPPPEFAGLAVRQRRAIHHYAQEGDSPRAARESRTLSVADRKSFAASRSSWRPARGSSCKRPAHREFVRARKPCAATRSRAARARRTGSWPNAHATSVRRWAA